MECPFRLDKETRVTVSLGLETTHSVGAAYNTRLYIDQVRLYSKGEVTITPEPDDPDHIAETNGKEEEEKNVDVYNLQGIKLRDNVPASQATNGLPQGIYVVGTQKVVRL